MDQVKLYGSKKCHKTNHYINFLNDKNISFSFFDVIEDEKKAKELTGLYKSGKLNFPTILIGHKKLRNPNDKELLKWLSRAEAANFKSSERPIHDSSTFKFTCGIDITKSDCGDAIEY